MNNVKKLKLNTISSVSSRIVLIISGLILPRLILLYYGSEVNGLVNSINQFLSIITFLDLGVGTVVQSALYKPLAEKNSIQISRILKAAKIYFRRIAYILVIYVFILIVIYPRIINNASLNIFSTALLIFAISISQFAQYFFGIINEFLLNADQKGYVQFSAEIIVVILNLIVSAVLIIQETPIYTVKLIASIVFLIRPFFLNMYVNKNYKLNFDIELDKDPIPQKWNGMGQHIAYSIQNSTDITVLTLLSTLSNVSVYSVYNFVTNALKLLITAFTSGIQSFFGNLLANDEHESLYNYFSKFEWGIHTIVTVLYSITAVLITPFVMLYTAGIEDANYYQPVFGLVLVLSRAAYSLRTPYQSLVFSAGHFRETQKSSILEAVLNIIISLILLKPLGLVGVAIGSLISMIYRTVFLVKYLSKNIIRRPFKWFIKNLIVDGVIFGIIYGLGSLCITYLEILSFIDLIIVASLVSILAVFISLIINLVFYREILSSTLNQLIKRKI